MLLMEFNYWREGLTHEKMMECIAKRTEYTYPEGITPIAEYWPAGVGHEFPAVVSIFQAEDFSPFLGMEMYWSEYFEMKWFPIVDAEEGVKFIREASAELETLLT